MSSNMLPLCTLVNFHVSTESACDCHMVCTLSWVGDCKECSRTAEWSLWVTARVACSGSKLGSVRMAVVVLRRRSERRTTEKIKQNTNNTSLTKFTGNIRRRSVLRNWSDWTHWVLTQEVSSAGPARREWTYRDPPYWLSIPSHYRTQTVARWWYWTDRELRKHLKIIYGKCLPQFSSIRTLEWVTGNSHHILNNLTRIIGFPLKTRFVVSG